LKLRDEGRCMSTQKACRDFDALLSAYVDHEVAADEMAIVETHTRSCDACACRLNQYATLVPRLEANIRAVLSAEVSDT
jgi:anti-sigma factor RsiW